MKRKHLVLALLSALFMASCTKQINEPFASAEAQDQGLIATEVDQAAPRDAPHKPYVPNEILVKFSRGLSLTARSNALAHVSGAVKEKVLTRAMQDAGDNEGFVVVHTPLAVLDAVTKLRGGP